MDKPITFMVDAQDLQDIYDALKEVVYVDGPLPPDSWCVRYLTLAERAKSVLESSMRRAVR